MTEVQQLDRVCDILDGLIAIAEVAREAYLFEDADDHELLLRAKVLLEQLEQELAEQRAEATP